VRCSPRCRACAERARSQGRDRLARATAETMGSASRGEGRSSAHAQTSPRRGGGRARPAPSTSSGLVRDLFTRGLGRAPRALRRETGSTSFHGITTRVVGRSYFTQYQRSPGPRSRAEAGWSTVAAIACSARLRAAARRISSGRLARRAHHRVRDFRYVPTSDRRELHACGRRMKRIDRASLVLGDRHRRLSGIGKNCRQLAADG